MGVDQTSLDRIRNATFPSSRRGYDKQEVEKFLARLADWLETGGGDQARSDLVRRELERVGEKTARILTAAEDAAEKLNADADAEAEEARAAADRYAAERRAEAEQAAKKQRDDARAEAERVVEAANRRKQEIETVISDLEERRDAIVAELERLAGEVSAIVIPRKTDGEGASAAKPKAAPQAASRSR
jgi:DivIVA domain-containing protein